MHGETIKVIGGGCLANGASWVIDRQ
jgi:hypothetical protein